MDNYQAIVKMNRQQLEVFLNDVYCAGLNDGMFAMRQPEDVAVEILDNNPFDKKWLSDSAEKALVQDTLECEDRYLLDALTNAVLRNAGIDKYENGPSGNTVIF